MTPHAEPHAPGTLLVTGAAGFLGAAIVAAARARGHAVRAVARGEAALAAAPWRDDPGVEVVVIELGGEAARARLGAALDGATAAIHAAAAFRGDDAAHARDTVAPTRALVEALADRPAPPPLVLVSSLAVYGFAALPAGATLDETTPLEPDPARRDAYCRAKLAQEALARGAAQTRGLRVRALRPGAIYGPGRLRSARLGFAIGPVLMRGPADAAIPAIHVADCAEAVVRAAETPPGPSDIPVLAGGGGFEAINLVAPEPPSCAEWLAAIRPAGWPRIAVPMPARALGALAPALSLAVELVPALARLAPGALLAERFDARFKPLCFAAARLEDRLGLRPERPFAAAMRAAAGDDR